MLIRVHVLDEIDKIVQTSHYGDPGEFLPQVTTLFMLKSEH